MNKKLLILLTLLLAISCQNQENAKIPVYMEPARKKTLDVDKEAERLKNEGYKTFIIEEGDTSFLMQQYFLVLLKKGQNRSQDSTTAAQLQKEHMEHLTRMYEEGYTSLAGPMGDDGEIRGIVVYNVPTQQMADSLANMDPMVKAGRLKVEVLPWWAAKGGKLN